jgi:type I restriction enzyme S subunit
MKVLPHGWSMAQIGSLCTLENGRAFKPSEWTTDGLPIVRIQNLNNPVATFNYYNGEFSDRYYLRGGELLFAWSGTPGTSFGAHVWRGSEAVLNQHIFRVDFNEAAIDKRFLRFAINQKLNELIDVAHGGVGLRHVTKGKFESTEIALAPLNEQKCIADKLDAILARVAACRERLDRIPGILKRFRQSVLAAATSGILTEEWRAERKIDASWNDGTLELLLDVKPRNGYSPRSVDKITSVKALTLTATTSGKFRGEYFKYIDEDIPKNSHLWLQPGDILIQRANTLEYVGTSVLYEGFPAEFIYPDLMMKTRANNQVLPRFLLYILQSDKVRVHFRVNATGTAGNMPKINQSTVLTAPVSWPIIEEQTEIVRRVESLFTYADRLEARYTAARAQIDKLTPAILAKAFRGELVPQDPNDEPASVLLEWIRQTQTKAREDKIGLRNSVAQTK